MNQLSPEARRLFQLARGGDQPSAQALQRAESNLASRISRGVVIAAVSTVASKAAATATVTLPWIKIAMSVSVAAAITGAGWWSTREFETKPTAAPRVEVSAPVARRGTGIELPTPTPIAARAAESNETSSLESSVTATSVTRPTETDESSSAESSVVSPVARVTANPDVAATANPKSEVSAARVAVNHESEIGVEPASPNVRLSPTRGVTRPNESHPSSQVPPTLLGEDPLEVEIRALRDAQQALRAGQGARVLNLLREQERAYPSGTLHEERAAAKILGLCQVGQADAARREAAQFERSWPKSPLLARLRRACWTR